MNDDRHFTDNQLLHRLVSEATETRKTVAKIQILLASLIGLVLAIGWSVYG